MLMLLGSSPFLLAAQDGPEIAWKTNAHEMPVSSVAFSPDGTMLASSSISQGFDGSVKVWRIENIGLAKEFTLYQEDVYSIAFSPDGNYLAEGGGGGNNDVGILRIWDVNDWEVVARGGAGPNDFVAAVAFSRDSRWAALLNGRGDDVTLMNPDGGLAHGNIDDPASGLMSSLALSPKNDTLATGGEDGSVTLWAYTNGLSNDCLLWTYAGQSGIVSSMAFLPNGEELASASHDSTVMIRRLADGVITRTFQDSNAIGALAISPDGKLLLTASTKIKFWRTSDGTLLKTYDQETEGVGPVAISADGKYFAYGRSDGAIVLAWMPVLLNGITRSGNQTILQWQGGSGLYQLQRISNLGSGSWENVGGPTSSLAATNSISGAFFYRVQSLPNP